MHFLYKAAEELIIGFEKPGNLLWFLTNCVQHLYHIQFFPEEEEEVFVEDRQKDRVFDCLLLIQEIVRAWYEYPGAPVEPIAEGIKKAVSHMQAQGYADLVGRFRIAISQHFADGWDIRNNEQMIRHYTAFLMTIPHINDYAAFQMQERKKAVA